MSRCKGRVSHWRGLIPAFTGALLGACSINPPLDLSEIAAGGTPPLALTIPFYPQTEFHCGPAALAGLLGAAGVQTNPDILSPQIYLPQRQGSLQVELLAAARRAGRIPYVIEDDPRILIAQIEAGRPVLVLQNLLTRHFPNWHYAVLVGFDPSRNRVTLNSGAKRGVEMKVEKFLRTWDWGGRWAMVALRPGELPAMPQAQAYTTAAADFEAVAGPAAAAPAWQAAMERWPLDSHPHLALGNQAYARGDLAGSVAFYRRGLGLDSENLALRNNLASVLGELGCARIGEAVLGAAADGRANDAHWQSLIAATRSELAARQGQDPDSCAALVNGPP